MELKMKPALNPAKAKVPRAAALPVAREMSQILQPLTERLIIAGSLRRRKAEVSDVEVLYIPRFVDWPDPSDIFGALVPTNAVDHLLKLALEQGHISKRLNKDGAATWGATNKYAVHTPTGIPIDFFSATRATWACNLVCRTGPAHLNTIIASRALERGWTWQSTGEGFERIGGPDRGKIKPMSSEQEIFAFVGLEYLTPEERL